MTETREKSEKRHKNLFGVIAYQSVFAYRTLCSNFQTLTAPYNAVRGTQRYRRGAHNVTLNASAKLVMTQHFAMKGRTQPPPASDPASIYIINSYTAPVGARRVLEEVIPPTHDRNDLSADPIYFHHPSAREDLQHPLLLQPASPALSSVIIEFYFITGVYSTNSQNDSSCHVYIYLPNDYGNTTNIIDILTTQLDSMQTTGCPASSSGI